MKLINKIKIKLLSASRFLQNNYYYTNLTILNHHQQIDILKRSYNDYNFYNDYNLFKRKRFSSITNENSIKENEINDLTTLNEDELLWKLKLYLFTKKDVEDYWKILQVYMKDIRDMRDTRDTRDMRKIDMSSVKDIRDMRDMRDTKDTTHTNDIKNTTHTKDIKDTTHNRDIKGDKRDDDFNFSKLGDFNITTEIFNLVLLSCSNQNQRKLSNHYFYEMIKKKNLKPNELTFQYLIISHIGNDGVGSSGSSGSSSGSRGPHESHGSHRSHASRESRGSRGPRESHKRKENFLEILRESIDFYKLMKRKFLLKPTEITSFILVNGIVYQDKLLSNGELLPLTIVDVLPELSHELLDNLQFKINPEINKKVTNKYLQSLFSTLLKYNYTNEAENVYKTIHSRKQG
ncbi:nuclear receptor coactivator 5 isoform X1 [Rhizophagus irregularis DAOM 181602=DAOM 197198]|nr:nuclear receptor coactivator 5 isoform X1 [Rhizophagus irregularis DAOM 181602=DAOM 197198]